MGTPSIPPHFGAGELSARSVEIRWRVRRTSSAETLVPAEGAFEDVGGRGTQSATLQIPLQPNDEGAEWRKEKQEDRFLKARNGDMLSIPFQCDFCWVVNLTRREYNPASPRDRLLIAYTRRVNLDMMWSREESTVGSTLSQIKKGKSFSAELGLEPVGIAVGPWPVGDQIGFQVALELLRASQKKGRNDDTYVQFDSIRKIRSAYANVEQTSPRGVERNLLMKDGVLD